MYKNLTDLIPNVYIPLGLWDSGNGLGAGLEDFLLGKEKEVLARYAPKEGEERGRAVHQARFGCANAVLARL